MWKAHRASKAGEELAILYALRGAYLSHVRGTLARVLGNDCFSYGSADVADGGTIGLSGKPSCSDPNTIHFAVNVGAWLQ